MPHAKMAHQVIYLPATVTSPMGSVYVFGGLENAIFTSTHNFRYDIATNQWHPLPEWKEEDCRISFNLLPLVNF